MLALIAAALAFSPFHASSAPLSLEDLSAQVRSRNLSIQAARHKWEAMKARIPQEKAWEDPMVGVDVERMGTTRLFTYSDNEWMVSQTVPVWGKNLSKGRAATAEAVSAFEELRRAELDALEKSRSAYYKLAAAYGKLEITHRNEELLQQLSESTQAGYEAGSQNQADLLMAQTEWAKVAESQREIEADIAEQEAQINVLLNQPAKTPLGRPADLAYSPPPLSLDSAGVMAVEHRPEIRMADQKKSAENARLELAHRQWLPDPQFRIEARQFKDSGGGIREYDTGIFFSLPWVNYAKYSAGVREAKRNVAAAQVEAVAARNEALGMVREKFARIEEHSKSYLLYRDKVLPLAAQTVQALRAEYESGKNTLFPLLTARRSHQEVEMAALDHLMNYRLALAELESMTGAPALGGRSSVRADPTLDRGDASSPPKKRPAKDPAGIKSEPRSRLSASGGEAQNNRESRVEKSFPLVPSGATGGGKSVGAEVTRLTPVPLSGPRPNLE